jgi:hypothetical protein
MHEAEMPPDDFPECLLGVVIGVSGEQFEIGVAHVRMDDVAAGGNPTMFFR